MDPAVHPHLARAALTLEEVGRSDVVVILTDHAAFDTDLLASARHVLDCRSRLKAADDVEVL